MWVSAAYLGYIKKGCESELFYKYWETSKILILEMKKKVIAIPRPQQDLKYKLF